MQFRNDIQILRGISVLLVVLFHLEIPGVQSGFLGVDVFFVISGFLMAVLYNPQKVKEFFSKRSRRLLPTYFFTILATLIVSYFLVKPIEFRQVVEQGLFASIFSSNFGFWLQNSYFSKAEFNPLLHLWSLGVEIQFYLIVPFLAWFFSKHRSLLPLVLLGSLVACFLMTEVSTKTSFFIMPFRLWEFLIGYYVAERLTNNGGVVVKRPVWGFIGLVLLCLIPLFSVDVTASDYVIGHPGLIALAVTIATAVILWAGIPAVIENSLIGRAFVELGKYSYSIYLVHFPVIVLFLYSPFSGTVLHPDGITDTLILSVLIIVLSFLVYQLVEMRSKLFSKPVILLTVAFSIVFLGPLIKNVHFNQYPKQEQLIFNAFTDRGVYRCGKIFRLLNMSAQSCPISEAGSNSNVGSIILIGDSHSDSIKDNFAIVAERLGVNAFLTVGNNSLTKNGIKAQIVMKEVEAVGAQHVVLHYSPGRISVENIKEFLELVKGKGIKVSFLKPVPVWNAHVPKTMYAISQGEKHDFSQSIDDYNAYNKLLFDEIAKWDYDFLTIYETTPYLCPDSNCKYMNEKGELLYFDSSHLTLTGAKELEPLFERLLK